MEKCKHGKSTVLRKKALEILKILKSNPEGLRVKTICKLTGYATTTTYNNLRKLEQEKLVINLYPIWKFSISPTNPTRMEKLLSSDKVQAHKFSFVLRLIHKPSWWSSKHNYLLRFKSYSPRGVDWIKRYEQLYAPYFLIQVFSNSIVFINQKKYWSVDAYDAFILALEDTLIVLDDFESTVNFKFFKDSAPQLSVRSNHFVKLKDVIATRCKRRNELFSIFKDGVLRCWIDFSEPFGLEFGHKDYAVEDVKRYSQVVDDYIDKGASLPSEIDNRVDVIAKSVESLVNVQGFYAENISSHVSAIRALSRAVKKLESRIDKLKDAN